MTHEEKIQWMTAWAKRNDCQLQLNGLCGFSRECVGILSNGLYPDYDKEETWTPENAYHKHPCVAVLGRGEVAESQLYDWLKWFDDNGYVVDVRENGNRNLNRIERILCKHLDVKMVKL